MRDACQQEKHSRLDIVKALCEGPIMSRAKGNRGACGKCGEIGHNIQRCPRKRRRLTSALRRTLEGVRALRAEGLDLVMTYQMLGQRLSISQQAAHQNVSRAERDGFLVRYGRGLAVDLSAKGERALRS